MDFLWCISFLINVLAWTYFVQLSQLIQKILSVFNLSLWLEKNTYFEDAGFKTALHLPRPPPKISLKIMKGRLWVVAKVPEGSSNAAINITINILPAFLRTFESGHHLTRQAFSQGFLLRVGKLWWGPDNKVEKYM